MNIANNVNIKPLINNGLHADTKPLRMKIRNICGDETIITLEEQK